MKKNIALTLVGIAVGAACMTSWRGAHAGLKSSYPVVVNTTTHHAEGSVGSARNSADSTQYLFCAINYSIVGGVATLTCQARDSSGNTQTCTYTPSGANLATTPSGSANLSNSADNILLAQVASVSGDSYIAFNANSAGTCTSLYVENGSNEVPKSP